MRIEVFYFEDCPNYRPALDRLRTVLRDEGVNAEVSVVKVNDASTAERLQLIGSPTIRVNGIDIEAAVRALAGGGLACRRYSGGLPSEAMIRAALKEGLEK
jgi:hypothetical protein